jgi:hypothetical protein
LKSTYGEVGVKHNPNKKIPYIAGGPEHEYGKEKAQRRNDPLRKVPCGARSIYMAKRAPLRELHII